MDYDILNKTYILKYNLHELIFRQVVFIPNRVEKCHAMFRVCEILNQRIIMSKNTKYAISMFRDCKSFNQKVDIPEETTQYFSLFEGYS